MKTPNKSMDEVLDSLDEPVELSPHDKIVSIKCCIIEGHDISVEHLDWLVRCAEALEYYTKLRSSPVSPRRARDAFFGPEDDQPKKLIVEDIEE